MAKQITIGIIIFRRENQAIRYLLLHHGGEYWNFPKGRVEPGEAELATALRELGEETGINQVKITEGFYDQYDYDFDTVIAAGVKEKIYKHAIFFLGEVTSDQVKISDEHLDFGWFDFATAQKRLFYQTGRDLLQRANQFLLRQQDFVL